MSTKTTFKRIALVAVASPGFGVLTSVAPVTAAVQSVDDIHDDRVWINKSVHGQTKSKAGIRSVPLVSPFIVFPKSPKTLRKVLKPYGVDIHSLRHTYAYLLKQQGVHVTTAQRLLGHSDPRVTMSIYTQVLDNEIDDVGLLLSKAASF
jgi:integrase